ncbi:EAL domain-containing protein [Brenneria tiliae]|uniref:EAL domain-containing protein n=1 Tax=Brenneria tiliae TaxID=2914984 RepID=UPI002014E0DF|nr:EAL domain-containing protein [Brenneria tiliae]MCL2898238.1 EAL domain-containing protein [Brenneria tiliae]MCL2902588.1 EAL domain-containing protein [Brenneria tiliae]
MVDSVLDLNGRWHYVTQPIYNCQYKMFAMELLARDKDGWLSTKKRIQAMSPSEKQILLIEQLECISEKRSYFIDNDVLVTVNIDFVTATFLLQDRFLSDLLDSSPFIHLKIDEMFPNLNDGKRNPLLAKLHERYPLWLNDLGRGNASLYAVTQSVFSYIKLDKNFYLEMMKSSKDHIFPVLVKNMKKFCRGVIIDGVQDYAEYEYLKCSGIEGMQGNIYPTYLLDNLPELPTQASTRPPWRT